MLLAYKKLWKNTFNYKGITSRKDFLLSILAMSLIFIPLIIGSLLKENIILFAVIYLFGLAHYPSFISAQVRRLRDAGFSWKFMFLYIVPILNMLPFILCCLPSKIDKSRNIIAMQEQEE